MAAPGRDRAGRKGSAVGSTVGDAGRQAKTAAPTLRARGRRRRGAVCVGALRAGQGEAGGERRTPGNFSRAEPAHELALSGLEDGHLEDVDGDGFTDLVTHYDAPATGLEPGDTEACLTGSLADGTAFEGCDEVRVFGTPGRGAR